MNRLLLPAPATKQEPLTEETAPELDTRMPNPQPEYLMEPEHAHLLAPFANPNPL